MYISTLRKLALRLCELELLRSHPKDEVFCFFLGLWIAVDANAIPHAMR